MTNLFQLGDFVLHSGQKSNFKIDCDALTDEDWECLAALIAKRFNFRDVVGVPQGGLKLAEKLHPFSTSSPDDPNLIVDDVLTTGRSMLEAVSFKQIGHVIGVVVFARGHCPDWVTPIFQMWKE